MSFLRPVIKISKIHFSFNSFSVTIIQPFLCLLVASCNRCIISSTLRRVGRNYGVWVDFSACGGPSEVID